MDEEKLNQVIDEVTELLGTKKTTVKLLKKHHKFLAGIAIRSGEATEKVVNSFLETIDKIKRGTDKDKIAKSLNSIRRKFTERSGFASSKPYLAIIAGSEHKTNDITGGMLDKAKAVYNKLIKDGDEDKLLAVEIEEDEYNDIIKEYKSLSSQNEDEALSYLEDALENRWVVIKNPPENKDENVEKQEEIAFINSTVKWRTGNVNFNYGELLEKQPSRSTSVILLSDDYTPSHITLNVKGEDRIKKLMNAPMWQVCTITMVKNEEKGKAWYVDNAFEVVPLNAEEEKVIFGTNVREDIQSQVIEWVTDAIPDDMQITAETMDTWERKMTKKTKKTNHVALLKGGVFLMRTRDNGSMSLIIDVYDSSSEDDIDDFDPFAKEDEDAEDESVRVTVSVAADKIKHIDFEEDSEVIMIVQVYRGKAWDRATNKQLNKLSEKPSANLWGIIADPYAKISKTVISIVDSSSFAEDGNEEEIDDDYEVNID